MSNYGIQIRFDHVSADAEPQPIRRLYFLRKTVPASGGGLTLMLVLVLKNLDEIAETRFRKFRLRTYRTLKGAKSALSAECVRNYRNRPHYFVEIVDATGDNVVVWPRVLDQLAKLG